MHKLLIEDDEGKTVAVPLVREEITIGRREGNAIRLTEQNVSRNHAKITLRDNSLGIEDLGSYNGTHLNGKVLTGASALKDGDVIVIGDYRLGIQEDKKTAAASNPAASVKVSEVMEGQPTLPVSTLSEELQGKEPPARLVVTGEILAGQEFILNRPSLVIGRTSENDVVLNHKSISRHHAKIIRDGDRYTIVDLESANGVRVRGMDRERSELRAGDWIELGEVRLRFVLGEDPLADDSRTLFRGRNNLLYLGGGAALLLAVYLLYTFSAGDKKEPVPEVAKVMPPPAQVAPPSPPPPAPAVPLESLLASARTAADAEKWEEALTFVEKATLQEPGSTEAAVLRKTIETEKETSAKVAVFKTALEAKNFGSVLDAADSLPTETRYKATLDELVEQAKAGFIALHLEQAAARLAENHCDDARREAEVVIGVSANHKKALGIIKRCDALAAAPPPEPRKVEPAKAAPTPKPKVAVRAVAAPPSSKITAMKLPPAAAPPTAPVDPDLLIKDAQGAWLRGQYALAIDSARRALKARPGLTNAYQIIAVCSCALKDADSAEKAYQRLDERNRQYVRNSCQKNGISF